MTDLRHPPREIFGIGDFSALAHPSIAVVGTRNPTPYGARIARQICDRLARSGVCLVSGMARGIDSIAHNSALEFGSATIAVLGTGVDVPYPVTHSNLHRRIGETGLLLSESAPGSRAGKGSFPRRNRLIAALAPVTIVIEAGNRSGALNTVSHALDLGRTVAAVPGPIDSPQSAGTNGLIRDGAVVIATLADALMLAGVRETRADPTPQLSASEEAVWKALGRGAREADSLAAMCGLPAAECLAAITSLEMMGLIECALTGEIGRR